MSTPRETVPDPIDEADMARAVAWVDGDLQEPERSRFELRLAAEPNLRAAVMEFVSADDLTRRLASAETRVIQAGARFQAWKWALATAAAGVLTLTLRAILAHEPRAELQVALAPGFESAREWVADNPALAGLRPPGLDPLRSQNEPANIDANAYVERARAAEAKLFDAQPLSSEPTRTGFFVLPLRSTRAMSVIVLGLPEKGSSARLYPADLDAAIASTLARLPAGDHVLPSARAVLADDGASVEYQRGFLVPVGAVALDVVFAARAEPLGSGELAAIDAFLRREPKSSVVSELARLGFEVRTLRVLEPRN